MADPMDTIKYVRSLLSDFPVTRDFRSMAPPGLWVEGEGVDGDFISGGDCYEWYYSYAHRKRTPTRRILEIGVRYGYSAVAMIMGSMRMTSSIEYVGFDNGSYGVSASSAEERMRGMLPSERVSIRVFDVDTQALSSFGDYVSGRFDLVHIDGDHSQNGDAELSDMRKLLPHISDDGVVIIDDIRVRADMMPDLFFEMALENQFHICKVTNHTGQFIMTRLPIWMCFDKCEHMRG